MNWGSQGVVTACATALRDGRARAPAVRVVMIRLFNVDRLDVF
jgi:hypothetical protein